MTRFVIYLFPALADVIIAATMFVCSNRLADAGKNKTQVAMVFTAWAAVYIISNQVLARFVNSRNAAKMMIAANLFFTAISVAFIIFKSVWGIYTFMAILAVASAMFFLPFQIFMKAAEPDKSRGVIRPVALYTFAWSSGFAAGPFIAGFIYQWLNWQSCFVFTALLALLIAAGVKFLSHLADHTETLPTSHSPTNANYQTMPDLAWLGWLVAGVGCLGVYLFLSLLPSVGVSFAIPKSQIGSMIATLYLVQAFVGLTLLRGRTWMFRTTPLLIFAAFGLLGLTCFAISLSPAVGNAELLNIPIRTIGLFASVASYGIFSGSFFFALVFHSLVHPSRSARYIAVNETVVGACGVIGPIIAGSMADNFGFLPFTTILIAIIASTALLQFIVINRLPPSPAAKTLEN